MFNLEKIFADHDEDDEIKPKVSLSHENLEQIDINIKSTEEDEEESFAGSDDNDQSGDSSSDNSGDDSSSSDDSDDWGSEDGGDMDDMDTSDIGGDMDDMDSGDSGDSSGDDSDGGDDGNGSGQGELETNLGSTTNPFTQVNQKMWLLTQMNLLRSSISNAIVQYNQYFADSAELRQLKQLLDIVTEERKSFIMSQNPENLIKYQLFREQFSNIVRNLCDKLRLNESKKK